MAQATRLKIAQAVIAELKQENKELKEELDVWVNPRGEVVMNREGVTLYEEAQEEIRELKDIISLISSGEASPEEIRELKQILSIS